MAAIRLASPNSRESQVDNLKERKERTNRRAIIKTKVGRGKIKWKRPNTRWNLKIKSCCSESKSWQNRTWKYCRHLRMCERNSVQRYKRNLRCQLEDEKHTNWTKYRRKTASTLPRNQSSISLTRYQSLSTLFLAVRAAGSMDIAAKSRVKTTQTNSTVRVVQRTRQRRLSKIIKALAWTVHYLTRQSR